MVQRVLQLKCECNSYPWGRTGKESLAATLCAKTNPDFKLENDKPYAEMWMGTYPDLPSKVMSSGKDLQEVLNANADLLIGKPVLDKFGKDLPFLPKILSISKALPLQIHPDIELSKKLHKENPEKYTDPNHKPEIAVALGKFEVFVGFKPLSDIQSLLSLSALKQFRPSSLGENDSLKDHHLKDICLNMLTAQPDLVKTVQGNLANLAAHDLPESQRHIQKLLPRLQEQYTKEDNGTLVALICMNFLTLEAGDAVYVPADGIHAYLSGNIVECMARSNNVINTGFCPRADRDPADLFVNALTFQPHDPKGAILEKSKCEYSATGKTGEYKPPLSEFNLMMTKLMKPGEKETIKEVEGPSVLFVTQGKGVLRAEGQEHRADEGYIYFIGQGVEIEFEAEEGGGWEAARAYAV